MGLNVKKKKCYIQLCNDYFTSSFGKVWVDLKEKQRYLCAIGSTYTMFDISLQKAASCLILIITTFKGCRCMTLAHLLSVLMDQIYQSVICCYYYLKSRCLFLHCSLNCS